MAAKGIRLIALLFVLGFIWAGLYFEGSRYFALFVLILGLLYWALNHKEEE